MTLYPSPTLLPSTTLYPGGVAEQGGTTTPPVDRGTNQMLAALSIEGPDGLFVDLLQYPYRRLKRAEGLAGIRVREVVVPRVGRRGTRNRTRHRDDAQITFTGLLLGDSADRVWEEYDEVARALAGAVDTDRLMKWTAGTRKLQQKVRLSSFDDPVEAGPNLIAYQAVLRASDPNAYDQTPKMAQASPLSSAPGGGGTYPKTYPYTFAPPPQTSAAVLNEGTVATPAVFELVGGLTNPIVRLDADNALVFNGSIAAGDTLVVDIDARSVLLNGNANRRNLLDSASSRWFELPVGASTITLIAETFTDGAGLTVRWHDARE